LSVWPVGVLTADLLGVRQRGATARAPFRIGPCIAAARGAGRSGVAAVRRRVRRERCQEESGPAAVESTGQRRRKGVDGHGSGTVTVALLAPGCVVTSPRL